MSRRYTACILIIGNEVLSGRTQDANLGFLASRLNELGIQVAEARIIRDDMQVIADSVNEAREKYDYVLTTGGIGPTHDDITSESVARAFGLPFGRNAEAEAILLDYYAPGDVTEERLSMADMPEGAVLIDNPVSRAPGFQIANVTMTTGTVIRFIFGIVLSVGVTLLHAWHEEHREHTIAAEMVHGLHEIELEAEMHRAEQAGVHAAHAAHSADAVSVALEGDDSVALTASTTTAAAPALVATAAHALHRALR